MEPSTAEISIFIKKLPADVSTALLRGANKDVWVLMEDVRDAETDYGYNFGGEQLQTLWVREQPSVDEALRLLADELAPNGKHIVLDNIVGAAFVLKGKGATELFNEFSQQISKDLSAITPDDLKHWRWCGKRWKGGVGDEMDMMVTGLLYPLSMPYTIDDLKPVMPDPVVAVKVALTSSSPS
eukprot:TRINITY_DN68135_c3_g6_i1.p1 TRINITY_DN68135_c3_g6~~TRINITY_DN68135_c3_g6_i1.p1  ORF type:complete len:183 (+),score=24.03 TRINITY_DN68135_c3_g6_i1:133-681(+)